MLRSRLLDRGRAFILVYPEVTIVNKRGIPRHQPSDTPVKVRVTTVEDRSSDAELPGQVSNTVVRMTARSAPVGSWARVVYLGEEWDIATPPRFAEGVSANTQHVEFTLRSRNRLDEGGA
jgi:hypothetical protein